MRWERYWEDSGCGFEVEPGKGELRQNAKDARKVENLERAGGLGVLIDRTLRQERGLLLLCYWLH
jgi:hypothetical protein